MLNVDRTAAVSPTQVTQAHPTVDGRTESTYPIPFSALLKEIHLYTAEHGRVLRNCLLTWLVCFIFLWR